VTAHKQKPQYSKAKEKDKNNEGLLHHRERHMWFTA